MSSLRPASVVHPSLESGDVEPRPGQTELDAWEEALLASPLIEEGHLWLRQEPGGATRLVAYVVPAQALTAEHLRAHLRATLPHALEPDSLLLVSSLPRDARGLVDEAALARLPVEDAAVGEQWASRLHELPDVAEALVLERPVPPADERMHLADLLPG